MPAMPIAMSRQEWERITRWTNHDKEDPETVRRREYVRRLDATSRAMTSTWPNSLENVNKRNEELRRARLEAAEAKNTEFYRRYVKRKKEDQERLMFNARDIIFKNMDAPKLLLGAVIESVVLKERSEQLRFQERLRQEDAQQRRQDDDDIIRKANEWHALNKEKKARRFEANKQYQKDILDQAHEVSERARVEHEDELRRQREDNAKATQEINAIKKFDEEYKAAEKHRIWADMEKCRQEVSARQHAQFARDRLHDKLNEVLLRARDRVEARRRQTEKQIKEEKQLVLDQIRSKLESGDATRDAKEQAIREKVIKEKMALVEARQQSEQQKQEKLKQERAKAREQFLRDEEQRLKDLNTMRHWEVMNRFKNAELYDEFQENYRNEKARKIKEYREDILKLWKERKDREARELAERRYFYGELAEKKLRNADKKLLAHATALVEEARAHGRPERPILRAVDRYCRMHRLCPMPELPSSQREHFPEYSIRTSPAQCGAVEAIDEGRRDGLQADTKMIEKMFPPVNRPTDAERADGLQRPLHKDGVKLVEQSARKPECCRCASGEAK